VYTEHLRIPVGAGALHVERLGRAGPAVVLLHGFGTCAFLWRAVAPVLADAGCTVVSVDLLGHGESDRPPDAAFGPWAQAEYLERALTALRLPAVTVVGQDFGALVAIQLAAAYQRRVHRLGLLEPPALDDLPGAAIRSLQRASARSALSANSLFGARPLLGPLLQASVSDPQRMPERLLLRYLAPFVGPGGAADLLRLASAVAVNADSEMTLASWRGETLLWCGGRAAPADGEAPTTRIARWQAALPHAMVRPIITHQPPGMLVAEDAPAALASALHDWIT
jgi:pimeloyl-ACP methyl ester carboxylesterase